MSLDLTITQGTIKPTPIAITDFYSNNSQANKIGKNISAKVISRKNLHIGDQIKGPAIILEDETTVVVSSDFIATVGSDKCLSITKKLLKK